MITGIFEVHLITKPEYQPALFGYITNLKENKNLIRPRPTCAHALYGDYPIQPMLTFMINGSSEMVTSVVKEIETDMQNKNIPIIRTKIESMAHNKGVIDKCYNDHYFEFHFKVKINSTKEWNKLVELIVPYGGHLFYNPYSKTLDPIMTIRSYDSLTELENIYSLLVKILEDNNFYIIELEQEYSVYDSNVDLDKNWLFKDSPSNFIKELDSKMVFSF